MSETRRHWFGFNIESASDMEKRLERVLEARPGLSFRRIVETGAVAWIHGYRLVDLPEMGGPQVMHRRSPPPAAAALLLPAPLTRSPAPPKAPPRKKRDTAKTGAPSAPATLKGEQDQAKSRAAPSAPAPAPAPAPQEAVEPPKFSVKVPDKIESPPVVGDDNEEKGAALDQGANTGVELEEDTIDVDGFTLDFNSFLAK